MTGDRTPPRAILNGTPLEQRVRELRGQTRRRLRISLALAEQRLAATRHSYASLERYAGNLERRLGDVHAHPSTAPAAGRQAAIIGGPGYPAGAIALPNLDELDDELLEAVRGLAGAFGSLNVLGAAIKMQADQ